MFHVYLLLLLWWWWWWWWCGTPFVQSISANQCLTGKVCSFWKSNSNFVQLVLPENTMCTCLMYTLFAFAFMFTTITISISCRPIHSLIHLLILTIETGRNIRSYKWGCCISSLPIGVVAIAVCFYVHWLDTIGQRRQLDTIAFGINRWILIFILGLELVHLVRSCYSQGDHMSAGSLCRHEHRAIFKPILYLSIEWNYISMWFSFIHSVHLSSCCVNERSSQWNVNYRNGKRDTFSVVMITI